MSEDNAMILLRTHIEIVRQELSRQPLNEGEVRRVAGAGGVYVALRTTKVSDEYDRIYNMSIDDCDLSFYKHFGVVNNGAEVSV